MVAASEIEPYSHEHRRYGLHEQSRWVTCSSNRSDVPASEVAGPGELLQWDRAAKPKAIAKESDH